VAPDVTLPADQGLRGGDKRVCQLAIADEERIARWRAAVLARRRGRGDVDAEALVRHDD
jgi:hypothetical protein